MVEIHNGTLASWTLQNCASLILENEIDFPALKRHRETFEFLCSRALTT